MDKCPGCGADIVFGAPSCWECNEPLRGHTRAESEPLEALALDGDFDSDLLEDESPGGTAGSSPRQPAPKHVVTGLPPATVVAFIAQDEVQAGAISQLLSDCGIENYASLDEEGASAKVEISKILSIQVARENLEVARQIIADFTSQFDESFDS